MADSEKRFAVVLLTAPPIHGGDPGGAYVKVAEREPILRCVEMFVTRPMTQQMLAIIRASDKEDVNLKFQAHLSFSGVKTVVGGDKWHDQIAAAAEHIKDDITHVIVHDAARPAVAFTDLDDLEEAAGSAPAVGLAAPVADVVVEYADGKPVRYHDPAGYRLLLTPQAFTRAEFDDLAKSKVETAAERIRLLDANPLNQRVNNAKDAKRVAALLKLLPQPKREENLGPFGEAQW
ncbi:MAG: 2-C-methyl-D-erythritol 4-phosphate cytidylyltransferase [Planctomycetota bacterium]